MKMFHEFVRAEKKVNVQNSRILKWAAFFGNKKSCVQKKSMFTVENDILSVILEGAKQFKNNTVLSFLHNMAVLYDMWE